MVVNVDKKRKGGAREKIQITVPAHVNEGKSLVLLQGASGETGIAAIQAHMTAAWKMAESDEPTANSERRETEDEAEEECVAVARGTELKVNHWSCCR